MATLPCFLLLTCDIHVSDLPLSDTCASLIGENMYEKEEVGNDLPTSSFRLVIVADRRTRM